MERRALIAIAGRLPRWLTSDHLTLLGLLSMPVAGLAFATMGTRPWSAAALAAALLVNWFGDSLDGTLARVRDRQRPRYGYYVDHVIDLAGTAVLLAGMGARAHVAARRDRRPRRLLVSAEVCLATHVRGVFKMTFLGVGPTGSASSAVSVAAARRRPMVSPFGMEPFRLFDVGGVVAIAGMGGHRLVHPQHARCRRRAHLANRRRGLVVLAGGAGAASAARRPGDVAAFNHYVDATHARIRERSRPMRRCPADRRPPPCGDGGPVMACRSTCPTHS